MDGIYFIHPSCNRGFKLIIIYFFSNLITFYMYYYNNLTLFSDQAKRRKMYNLRSKHMLLRLTLVPLA